MAKKKQPPIVRINSRQFAVRFGLHIETARRRIVTLAAQGADVTHAGRLAINLKDVEQYEKRVRINPQ